MSRDPNATVTGAPMGAVARYRRVSVAHGSHDWRDRPKRVHGTEGAPWPERLNAIGVMLLSLGRVLRTGP